MFRYSGGQSINFILNQTWIRAHFLPPRPAHLFGRIQYVSGQRAPITSVIVLVYPTTAELIIATTLVNNDYQFYCLFKKGTRQEVGRSLVQLKFLLSFAKSNSYMTVQHCCHVSYWLVDWFDLYIGTLSQPIRAYFMYVHGWVYQLCMHYSHLTGPLMVSWVIIGELSVGLVCMYVGSVV